MKKVNGILILIVFLFVSFSYAGDQFCLRLSKTIPEGIEPAVKEQILKLCSHDPIENTQAAIALQNIGAKAEPAIPYLIQILGETGRVSYQRKSPKGKIVFTSPAAEAIEALVKIGTASIEPLIAVLKPKKENAAKNLKEGKNRRYDIVEQIIKDKEDLVRRNAAIILGRLYAYQADQTLMEILESKEENNRLRIEAAKVLGRALNHNAFGLLIKIYSSEDEKDNLRESAALALGRTYIMAAVEPLLEGLNDKNYNIRSAAAEALGSLRDKRALEPLIACLKDKMEFVRWRAASSLGSLGDAQAVKPLIEALKDKNENVRYYAARSLGNLGDTQAVKPLINALKDKDENVRYCATIALGNLGDTQAVKPLIDALKDKDEFVRQKAPLSLEKLTKQKFGNNRAKWLEWYKQNKDKL